MNGVTIVLMMALASCGAGESYDEATKPQITKALTACGVRKQQIEKGKGSGETAWTIAIDGKEPAAGQKLVCVARKLQEQGVEATSFIYPLDSDQQKRG